MKIIFTHQINQIMAVFLTLLFSCYAHSLVQDTTDDVTGQQTASQESTMATDFRLPLTLYSKNQALDAKNRTSIFIDNVVIKQGSLEILADRVEANATAGQGKEIITATGNPASYSQRLEDGSIITASANEIIYTVESQTISLKGNAAIVQNDVQVSGDFIAFDMSKEQIMASTDSNSETSVTTVLSPGAFKEANNQDDPEGEDEPN